MQSSKLVLAALVALAVVGTTGAYLGELAPVTSPAPRRPPTKALVSDPAEPPLKVEVASGGSGVAVASGARGTTVKFDTPGGWQGSAGLTFKDGAPPMRFTLTLAKMLSYDLESLTLVSGGLALAVGPVSAGTTKYFDAAGRALKAPEGAAFTVTARRWDGELDVQVRRAPGAALGKALTVNWKCYLAWRDDLPQEGRPRGRAGDAVSSLPSAADARARNWPA
jgi:hypothetical protein